MYTQKQLGSRMVRSLNSQSKDVYAIYVEMGGNHVPILIGADYAKCKNRSLQMIENGVNPDHIFGSSDARTNANFGHARKHLWLPFQQPNIIRPEPDVS